jgi:ribonuclease P protein component
LLSYKNRFHGYNALRYVYKNGRVVRGKYLTIKYSENKRRVTPRVAVVVSKKVHKSAVGRNRIRRRVYEQIRSELPKLEPQSDVVCIISSDEIRELEGSVLREILMSALIEAGVYKTDAKNDIIA